jgi:hypothetical protein
MDNRLVCCAGDIHIIRELKILNDNLKWRLHRQSVAVQKSAEVIHQLTQQNAILSNRLKQLSGEPIGAASRTHSNY